MVALLAMAHMVEAGRQAALMAPTEILARQHFATIKPLAEAAGIRLAILTGREKGRERAEALEGLQNGAVQLVVGTHALFQEGVRFQDLGLAVVDEQHRFGVHQRLAMNAKGETPDMLVMTATPIPRDELVGRIEEAVAGGQKAYWICPLVEESEEVDLTAAQDRFDALRPLFGERVGLIHGRMHGRDKDAAMRAFKESKTRVLVATTVIEVGVDVPDATIMVIEHAERFGLAQLHQLRGRVGRGSKPSTCVLLYKAPLLLHLFGREEAVRLLDAG